MKVTQEIFGELNNQEIKSFTLKNDSGMEVSVINYGCTITRITTLDKNGNLENIVLGFDTIEEYVNYSQFFGCIVGRVAGRIGQGAFELDGQTYQLVKNNGNNNLHGGEVGFDKKIWNASVDEKDDEISVIFTYESKDGEEGFPGTVNLKAKYTLNQKNELTLSYEGTTDKKTILNLTNHTYFNLSGNLKRDILQHNLTINSEHFLELNNELIPSGELVPVQNTEFDFRNGRLIQDGANSKHEQNLLAGNGYDHPFVLSSQENAIKLVDEQSGRIVFVETNQPSVVLYTGTQLDDSFSIRRVQNKKYLGLCLETQGYPDAVNQEHFPSIVVDKGEIYHSVTKFRFDLV